MAFVLLFTKDGRIIVPIDNETVSGLENRFGGQLEGRFDTKEAAEAEKERLDSLEREGDGWQGN